MMKVIDEGRRLQQHSQDIQVNSSSRDNITTHHHVIVVKDYKKITFLIFL